MSQRLLGIILMGALAVGAAGCSDSTGADGTVPVTVSLRIDGTAPAAAAIDGAALVLAGPIDPSEVTSLVVNVTGLSFLSCSTDCAGSDADPDSDCCGQWYNVSVGDAPVPIDLMALPTEENNPLVIASGKLPIGEYQRIRINVGEALIWFSTDQSKGQALFPANPDPTLDEGYPVTVPSGRLNTNVGLTVEDDGTGVAVEVSLVFDPNMTFQNVHTTGSGKVILTPQFRLF